jgi:hypothetical protein
VSAAKADTLDAVRAKAETATAEIAFLKVFFFIVLFSFQII